MLNSKLILASLFLIVAMIPLSSQQFSYSANWGKRSNQDEVINKSQESQSVEESLGESNIMDVLMTREEVCISRLEFFLNNFNFFFSLSIY